MALLVAPLGWVWLALLLMLTAACIVMLRASRVTVLSGAEAICAPRKKRSPPALTTALPLALVMALATAVLLSWVSVCWVPVLPTTMGVMPPVKFRPELLTSCSSARVALLRPSTMSRLPPAKTIAKPLLPWPVALIWLPPSAKPMPTLPCDAM